MYKHLHAYNTIMSTKVERRVALWAKILELEKNLMILLAKENVRKLQAKYGTVQAGEGNQLLHDEYQKKKAGGYSSQPGPPSLEAA